MRFCIFYKKLKIDWVLCDFYEPIVSELVDKIIKNTHTTKIVTYGNLKCDSKEDLEIIYKILTKEYLKKEAYKDRILDIFIEAIEKYKQI